MHTCVRYTHRRLMHTYVTWLCRVYAQWGTIASGHQPQGETDFEPLCLCVSVCVCVCVRIWVCAVFSQECPKTESLDPSLHLLLSRSLAHAHSASLSHTPLSLSLSLSLALLTCLSPTISLHCLHERKCKCWCAWCLSVYLSNLWACPSLRLFLHVCVFRECRCWCMASGAKGFVLRFLCLGETQPLLVICSKLSCTCRYDCVYMWSAAYDIYIYIYIYIWCAPSLYSWISCTYMPLKVAGCVILRVPRVNSLRAYWLIHMSMYVCRLRGAQHIRAVPRPSRGGGRSGSAAPGESFASTVDMPCCGSHAARVQ